MTNHRLRTSLAQLDAGQSQRRLREATIKRSGCSARSDGPGNILAFGASGDVVDKTTVAAR